MIIGRNHKCVPVVEAGELGGTFGRLMSLPKPLQCNLRFAVNLATLPIYYSSFLHWKQNQFQLKPTLAKIPPPLSWGER